MMSFLSYKVVRGTCLRFPEQLEVVVAGDVLQQRLPACSVALTVILAIEGKIESRKIFNALNGEMLFFFLRKEVYKGQFSPTYHVLLLLLLIEG